MRRRIAAEAEVAGRADDPLPEVVHPDAVHEHPRRQRIVLRRDGSGELEPAAAVREGLAIRIEHLEELARYIGAGPVRVAAQEELRIVRALGVEQRHGAGWAFRRPRLDVLDELLVFPLRAAVGEEREETPIERERRIGRGVRTVQRG